MGTRQDIRQPTQVREWLYPASQSPGIAPWLHCPPKNSNWHGEVPQTGTAICEPVVGTLISPPFCISML